ncbi:MAG: hypothetical protein KAG95_06385 [Bacteroidales bacterium]|nr:hypothetical protein [Bacteroidales bacterium]
MIRQETFKKEKGIEPVEYYDIFKEKYTLLNEIISMIEFLSKNLPSQISIEFYDYINNHLKEKRLTGDVEHIKTCIACNDKQQDTLRIIELRIKEISLLKEKIEKIIK